MQETFTIQLNEINLEFSRFYTYLGILQYVITYHTGAKDEIVILVSKDENDNWSYLFREFVPVALLDLEIEIGNLIKENENS